MGTKVKISSILSEHADIPAVVEVDGSTVGECLHDLIRQYPQARDWLSDQNGLLPVLVCINNEDTVTLNREGLDRVLSTGDELQIFAVIDGG